MMFAEEIATNVNWSLICFAGSVVFTGLAWWDGRRNRNRPTEISTSPSPLPVEIVKALHEQFADRAEFHKHVEHNTDRHAQLFRAIENVERIANAALEKQIEVVRKDLVSVGNHVAGLEKSTEMQNQQLARMDAKLDRLAERS